jgi:hypothetical protein
MWQLFFAPLARMALVFTGLAGTQRQMRIVAALGLVELATFPNLLAPAGYKEDQLVHSAVAAEDDVPGSFGISDTAEPLVAQHVPSEPVQVTEDAQASSFDWWSAAGMQFLTVLALVQQAPFALRRFRAFMFALMDAWSALNHAELAIVEVFFWPAAHEWF